MIKKILVISDIHGNEKWEYMCDKEFNNVDKIFLGDYLDRYLVGTETEEDMINQTVKNLKKLLNLKKKIYKN